jgi:hypothetical protein
LFLLIGTIEVLNQILSGSGAAGREPRRFVAGPSHGSLGAGLGKRLKISLRHCGPPVPGWPEPRIGHEPEAGWARLPGMSWIATALRASR